MPAEADLGDAKLRALTDDPTYRVLVDRLQLSVAAKRSDASRYQDSLARLQELRQDSAIDHARFWRLLATVGQQERASQLAVAYPEPGRSAPECAALLEAFGALRLYDHARLLFHSKGGREFWTSESVWHAYAAGVADSKDWAQLQRVAVEMRTETRSELHLSGYSYFLEALAASEVGDRQQTHVALQKMNRFWTGNGALALECARTLLQLGYAGAASELIAPFEPERRSDSAYWELQFALASALKNHELLLQAASNRFNLDPQDEAVLRQYATALLVNRREPRLAASIANKLLALDPDSAPAMINHARALLLSNQVAEARAALEHLSGRAISAPDATALSWALFQLHFHSKEYQEACRALDNVDTNLLFRPELAWLSECEKQMALGTDATL
jgi:predicted Zn-dependent protease